MLETAADPRVGENQNHLSEAVDVSRLEEEMLELMKVPMSRQVILRTDFRGDVPAVVGNVVMNLVLNASEAIEDGTGVITLTAAKLSAGIDLAV
jgi:hypothetical protein